MKKVALNCLKIALIVAIIIISIIATNRITIKRVEEGKEQLTSSGNDYIKTSEHLAQMASQEEKVIYLGTGTSFNVSSYEGYKNFTKDNFIVEISNASVSSTAPGWVDDYVFGGKPTGSASLSFSKSYNATTGKFTVSSSISISASVIMTGHDGDDYNPSNVSTSASKAVSTKVYLVTK